MHKRKIIFQMKEDLPCMEASQKHSKEELQDGML